MAQIRGFFQETGKTGDWHPLAATKLPDGSYILKVDTELTLDGANISITNLKVGSTDQTATNAKYLKTDVDGTVHVTGSLGSTLGVPNHYSGNANIAAATVTFNATTISLLVENLHASNDLFVSFDGDVNTHIIPSGEALAVDTAVASLRISASVDGTPYQILTTE